MLPSRECSFPEERTEWLGPCLAHAPGCARGHQPGIDNEPRGKELEGRVEASQIVRHTSHLLLVMLDQPDRQARLLITAATTWISAMKNGPAQ